MKTAHPIATTLFAGLALALASPVALTAPSDPEVSDPWEAEGFLGGHEPNMAPYFQVLPTPGADGDAASEVEHLPLKNCEARVKITGPIAEVELRQTFANMGAVPIEATYTFPASTGTAVHGMEMRIGDRRIRSVIQEKEEAKKTYETAKAAGKSASLLEQHRPNVFQTSVANILPGDEIEVILRYSEILKATDSIYEFVFPTAIGPRFSNRSGGSPDAADHAFVQNPFLKEGEAAPMGFKLDLEISSGLQIAAAKCVSHEGILIDYADANTASLEVTGSENADRDLIVRYQLAGEALMTGLTLHEGEDENFFMLNVQPPERVTPDHVPAREYVFVIDVSGSMRGFPLDLAKNLFDDLASGLRPDDTFNILLFAGGSEALSRRPLEATKANLRAGRDFLGTVSGGGGTQLVKALADAVKLPKSEDRSRSVVVITDGYISMEADAFELIREDLGGANLFAFGIGSSVNRHLIEGMARVGGGEPFVVTTPKEAEKVAGDLREYIESPVLTGIQIDTDGFEAFDFEPGQFPDVLAQRPLTLVGKWNGDAEGTITVRGHTGGGEVYEQVFEVTEAIEERGSDHAALRPLWARERVRGLVDYAKVAPGDEAKEEVIELGLAYSLLTPFTSFVAVDEVVRNAEADDLLSVAQPNALPKGVSNSAVGGGQAGSVPEPGVGLLLLLGALMAAMQRRR